MRKAVRLLSTGLTVAAVSAAGVVGAAPSAFATPVARSPQPVACDALNGGNCLVQFDATFVQREKLDLGAPGPSLGDEMILSMDLFQGGTKVGVADGVFTTTRVTNTSSPNPVVESQELFTLRLPSGQVSIQFIQLDDHEQVLPLAVTGGSGVFRGASGDGTLTKGDGSGVVRLHLEFPKAHSRPARHDDLRRPAHHRNESSRARRCHAV